MLTIFGLAADTLRSLMLSAACRMNLVLIGGVVVVVVAAVSSISLTACWRLVNELRLLVGLSWWLEEWVEVPAQAGNQARVRGVVVRLVVKA